MARCRATAPRRDDARRGALANGVRTASAVSDGRPTDDRARGDPKAGGQVETSPNNYSANSIRTTTARSVSKKPLIACENALTNSTRTETAKSTRVRFRVPVPDRVEKVAVVVPMEADPTRKNPRLISRGIRMPETTGTV